MRTSDAFYMKQYFFVGMLPFLAVVVVVCWRILSVCCKCYICKHLLTCKTRCKMCNSSLTKQKLNDYTILSLVLMTFLAYPMITRLTLSMLKCPKIGNQRWLMADLQEPCFEGRHMSHVAALTIPQLIIYVLGIPLAAMLFITRNIKNLHHKRFYIKYGLLYLGYRDERAWWEGVVAIRKVAIVSISTFGTLLGVVDVQAFLGLLVVFLSIVAHLVGLPFDMNRPNTRMLHNLEFVALVTCWMTFWGGLLFFIGHEKAGSIDKSVLIVCSVLLVLANVTLLLVSGFLFVREYLRDKKKGIKRRESKRNSLNAIVEHAFTTAANQTVTDKLHRLKMIISRASREDLERIGTSMLGSKPNNQTAVSSNEGENNGEEKVIEGDENDGDDKVEDVQVDKMHRIRTLSFTPTNHLGNFGDHEEAQLIHDDFHRHEEGLRQKTEQRQKRARRKTQVRLKARTKLKDSKALHKLKVFADLDDEEVDLMIDKMDHIVRFKGQEICHQHDVSDSFYIIVKGHAVVNVDEEMQEKETEEGNNGTDEENDEENDSEKEQKIGCRSVALTCPIQVPVATIDTLGFFGEAALLAHGERTATVVVASDRCELLRLTRVNFLKMMEIDEHAFKDKHHDHESILDQLKENYLERVQTNRTILMERRTTRLSNSTKVVPIIHPKEGLPNVSNERSLFS